MKADWKPLSKPPGQDEEEDRSECILYAHDSQNNRDIFLVTYVKSPHLACPYWRSRESMIIQEEYPDWTFTHWDYAPSFPEMPTTAKEGDA